MAINGTHMLFYTTEAEKLRVMLRDVFGFKHVDAGGGWLIFKMPPGEIGVHPDEGPTFESGVRHQITFMCDDITKTVADLRAKGVDVDPATKDEGYGITTMMHLPGGCDVMLYEPRHPIAADIKRSRKTAAKKVARKTKAKSAARRPRATARRGRQAKTERRRR
jgi:hypothetical protein